MEVDMIAERTSFHFMKNNCRTNLKNSTLMDQSISEFIRKGCIGDYANLLKEDQISYIDHLVKEKLKETGFY